VKKTGFIILTVVVVIITAFRSTSALSVEPAAAVPDSVMRSVYEEAKTPYKYGVVMRGGKGTKVDSPSVFRYGDRWYMVYIVFNDLGYYTSLAVSDDLLTWRARGIILDQGSGGWDTMQAAGYIALQDPVWGGTNELATHDGDYWMSYLGGALEGYETEPLSIGMAHTNIPDAPYPWMRISQNPVLFTDQPDTRWWEKATLYKSSVLLDQNRTLGHPFVMFYNAKTEGVERIGMAVSDDMKRWRRYGDDPLIDNGSGISGDPQVVRMGDVWVMFYFGAFWRPGAFDTFACSYDLVHWTKWTGPDLIASSEPWDAKYAHKPWVIKHDGVVYHFYCAVGDEGRVIALATSEDVRGVKSK